MGLAEVKEPWVGNVGQGELSQVHSSEGLRHHLQRMGPAGMRPHAVGVEYEMPPHMTRQRSEQLPQVELAYQDSLSHNHP